MNKKKGLNGLPLVLPAFPVFDATWEVKVKVAWFNTFAELYTIQHHKKREIKKERK